MATQTTAVNTRQPASNRLAATPVLAAFTATIFASAALLFVLEPMVASMLLPLVGGAASVWNTAIVFFQAVLLAGYAYANWLARRFTLRRQIAIHTAVVGLAAMTLPVRIPSGWSPPGGENPLPWLLAALAIAFGLPFFALSATSPLFQRWFAATGHPQAGDPYFLYRASNVGSLLALLAYPSLLSRDLGLRGQAEWWVAGYALFLAEVCDDAHLACTARAQAIVSPADAAVGVYPSSWFVIARSVHDLGALATRPGWSEQCGTPGDQPWTDDYSDIPNTSN